MRNSHIILACLLYLHSMYVLRIILHISIIHTTEKGMIMGQAEYSKTYNKQGDQNKGGPNTFSKLISRGFKTREVNM